MTKGWGLILGVLAWSRCSLDYQSWCSACCCCRQQINLGENSRNIYLVKYLFVNNTSSCCCFALPSHLFLGMARPLVCSNSSSSSSGCHGWVWGVDLPSLPVIIANLQYFSTFDVLLFFLFVVSILYGINRRHIRRTAVHANLQTHIYNTAA